MEYIMFNFHIHRKVEGFQWHDVKLLFCHFLQIRVFNLQSHTTQVSL